MLVALTVSLLATGAIYQLVTAGQSAFRREPALADRQQNIRVAMDAISRDVLLAGYGLPSFVRRFTPGLDGAGLRVEAPHARFSVASNQETDQLELDRGRSCHSGSRAATSRSGSSACLRAKIPPAWRSKLRECSWLFAQPGDGSIKCLIKTPAHGQECSSKCRQGERGPSVRPDRAAELVRQRRLTAPGGSCPIWVMPGGVVRLRINKDAAAQRCPNLERSAATGADGNPLGDRRPRYRRSPDPATRHRLQHRTGASIRGRCRRAIRRQ